MREEHVTLPKSLTTGLNGTKGHPCIFEAVCQKRAELSTAHNFLDCRDNPTDCLFDCANGYKYRKSSIALLYSLAKETYKYARYLYAMQKAQEEDKLREFMLMERQSAQTNRKGPDTDSSNSR